MIIFGYIVYTTGLVPHSVASVPNSGFMEMLVVMIMMMMMINHEGWYWKIIKYGMQKKHKSDYNHIKHRNMVTNISEEPASSIF
jgi:isoprenylcysteine carboxyl methyltransferase (ICMT) family protein YpbQ